MIYYLRWLALFPAFLLGCGLGAMAGAIPLMVIQNVFQDPASPSMSLVLGIGIMSAFGAGLGAPLGTAWMVPTQKRLVGVVAAILYCGVVFRLVYVAGLDQGMDRLGWPLPWPFNPQIIGVIAGGLTAVAVIWWMTRSGGRCARRPA